MAKMEKTDIVIVGYPKSGNTWVTRLVAELVGCPVVGFLNSKHNEIAREGLDRLSQFQCFKSHHQLHELRNIIANSAKVIYVVRDPRDICISGSKFFKLERWPFLGKFFKKFPPAHKIYLAINKRLISPPSFRVKRMTQVVVHGLKDVHRWVRIPWAAHFKPYLQNQYFLVKFEDLLSDPETECERIIHYLGIDRDAHQIQEAIQRQSFENRKKEFLEKGQSRKAKFLQTGTKEQWRKGMSKKQQQVFSEKLANELSQFGYPS